MAKHGKKHRSGKTVLIIILILLLGLPLAVFGLSFIGRITPDSVIPDTFTAYIRIPNPAEFSGKILAHEALETVLTEPPFTAYLPLISGLKDSRFTEKAWFRLAAKGLLDGALFDEGVFLAAWDTKQLSPLLRFLPALSRRLTVPNLYYVQAGKRSRFEYRLENGQVLYMGPHKNLLVISNNSRLFESVLDGTSRDGDLRGSDKKTFSAKNYDAAGLLSTEKVITSLEDGNPLLKDILNTIQFPGFTELTLSLEEEQINLGLSAPVSSGIPAVSRLLQKNSAQAGFLQWLPEETQYSTILSLGTLQELLQTVTAVSGGGLEDVIKKADSSARLILGLGLEDLLFSWTGTELAVFGLEGRPLPVFAVQIRDEQKRREIFDGFFSSFLINENLSFVLDGVRIPQIRLPFFLDSLLRIWDIAIPAPFYTVQNGYLLISESPENLLAAVSAIKRNSVLPRTDLWRSLSASGSDLSSLSLFYSLDRSVPFFLKGNGAIHSLLKLYRRGLLRLNINNQVLSISLSAAAGPDKGTQLLSGYPLSFDGEAPGNEVRGILYEKRGESRLFFSQGSTALSLDPQNNKIYRLPGSSPVWAVPLDDKKPKSPAEASAWTASSQGLVTLINGNMEPVQGFPLITGLRLSSPPAVFRGELYLADDSGVLYKVDQNAVLTRVIEDLPDPLRSPPVFHTLAGKDYMAAYPKSFLGEIWLTDRGGASYPNWPVFVSGIAFGSPLVFSKNGSLYVAFITQAGELNLFDQAGQPAAGFPVKLTGVFYGQPVFDGEYLWLTSAQGRLFRLSLTGEALFQDIPGFSSEEGHLLAFDIDKNTVPEIFFTGSGNTLHGYSRELTPLEGFPLAAWGRPFFGDLNGDGKAECAAMGLDGRLYRWQFK